MEYLKEYYKPFVIRNNQIIQLDSSEIENGERIFRTNEDAEHFMKYGIVPKPRPREQITIYKDEYESLLEELSELRNEVRRLRCCMPYRDY